MKLAEEILALHEGIQEVVILEEREGQFVPLEEATRDEVLIGEGLFDFSIASSVAPSLILGAANQLGGRSAELRLVGLLYRRRSVLFSNFDENKVLAVRASADAFSVVVEIINKFLAKLRQKVKVERVGVSVGSAEVAENIARFFLQRKAPGLGDASINNVAFNAKDQKWDVHGSFRPPDSILSKRFEVEIDAETGSVVNFSSVKSWPGIIYAEVASLAIAGGLLLWLLFSLWK